MRECTLRAAVGRCAQLQHLSHTRQQQRWVHEEDPCPTSVASGSRLSLQVLWRALGNTCFGPVLFSARLGDATCCPRAMSFVVATSQFKNAPSRTEFRNSWSVPTVSAQPNASKNSAEDLTMRWRWCRKRTRSRWLLARLHAASLLAAGLHAYCRLACLLPPFMLAAGLYACCRLACLLPVCLLANANWRRFQGTRYEPAAMGIKSRRTPMDKPCPSKLCLHKP